MSTRYDDRDYDRERQNYGRRGESDYCSHHYRRSDTVPVIVRGTRRSCNHRVAYSV